MANMTMDVALLLLVVLLVNSLEKMGINGEVYKVGDSAGWTTIGNVDYKQWAATKSFQLGDIIIFEYNSQFHNVMQVTHLEYRSCNTSAPIATHTTGNDTIIIANHGHHFFLCGVPGHCQSGQKVDINAMRASSMGPTPSSSPSPPVDAASVPAPNASEAAPLHALCRCVGNLVVAIAVFATFV